MSDLLPYLSNNVPQFRSARLGSLYSDFRHLSTINPDGYEANIAAWLSALSSASLAGVIPCRGSRPDLVSITIDELLLQSLETKEWGRPLALGTVVTEGMKRRELMLMRDFKESSKSVYHREWTIRPWDILGWGLRQLGLAAGQIGDDKLPVGRFVILANLETGAKEVERRIEGTKGRLSRVFSRAAFAQAFGDVLGKERRLTESDWDVLLRYLERDKCLLAYDDTTVKLKVPGDAAIPSLTAEDLTIASLKSLIEDLEVQTKALSERVESLGTTAKEAVAKNNRVSALAALRSKKLTEMTLEKRHGTLSQLEEIFNKIEQAADQVELIGVMEASTRVLSGLNKEVGGVNRVDDVVDQLREQMSQVDEIGNVVAEAGQAVGTVDESEVDDELEQMEREDSWKREEAERQKREEKENQEAEETRKILLNLEGIERQAAKQEEDAQTKRNGNPGANPSIEEALEESTGEMKRMSLEPIPVHIES